MSFPYLAKSTIKYKSPHATDLSFAKDEKIRVTGQSEDDEDWLIGESLDGSRSGGFPKDFVTPIEEEEEAAPESAVAAVEAGKEPESLPAESAAPPVSTDAPAPPSPKLDPAPLPPTPAPAAVSSPAQPKSTASTQPPAPSPTATRPPVTKAAPSTTSGDGGEPDPSQMTMKDRLAFFAAAQGKAGPPPPIKPKPASGGLTWSQRQKLRQEEEAKAGGSDVKAETPAPTPLVKQETATPQPTFPKQEKKEGTGMSAADAQTSIGKGGSLKERMAALAGAGAFGQAEEQSKPTPPAPSGKVWKRPPAPEPEYGDEDDTEEGVSRVKSPMTEEGDALEQAGEGEGQEQEQTEEEQEKARKAAIAARMAKLGARGPMSMALPPKPARKPTKESIAATSPTTEFKQEEMSHPRQEEKVEEKEAPSPAATSPPSSVPMPAVARRTAPPRRRGPAAAAPIAEPSESTPDTDKSLSIGPNNGAEPPPQVMVYDEEKPLPKTDEQLTQEKEFEDAAQKPGGVDGAKAAGIAMAPVGDSKEVPEMVPIHPPAESPSIENDEAPPPPPQRTSMADMPKDEVEMKQAQGHDDEEDEEEEDEAPPPPPQREVRRSIGGGDKPLGPRPLPSPGRVGAAPPLPPQGNPIVPPRDDSEDEEEENDDEEDVPPPPPARPSVPVPVPFKNQGNEEGEENDVEEEEEQAPPPPPVRRPSVPVPTKLQMPESPSVRSPASPRNAQSPVPQSPQTPMRIPPPAPSEDSVEQDDEEDEEDEASPPPPPIRRPSVPVPARLQMPESAPQSPASPRTTQSPVPQSPKASMRVPPPAPSDDATQGEEDEASRRSNIAARMAKLGGIKFGAPPVPNVKRSMSTGPSSAIDETPKSPIREVPTSPALEEEQGELLQETHQSPISPVAVEGDDGDETPEQEAARRRATLARLRAGGSLGFGMFGERGSKSTAAADDRGLEEETVQEEEEEAPQQEEVPPPPPARSVPPSPIVSKVAGTEEDGHEEEEEALPPPPPARPNASHSRSATAQSESDFAAPPPPPGRPAVPANRPMPPPPIVTEQNDAPAPPPRSALSPALPQSPGGRPSIPSAEQRMSQTQRPQSDFPPPPVERQMTEEPTDFDDAPSPPPRPTQTGSPAPALATVTAPASPRRSMSVASRSSAQPVMSPTTRQGSRPDEQSAQAPRSSVSQGRPGFNDLQEASRIHGSQLIRAAKAMFSQGKQAYLGDGSPAGFVATAMDNAHLPRPQGQWGYIILEQEGSSVLKRSDDPRPGDIAAFYDAKLKGKKGLSSYTQNVGSVEEPLVGIVSESESKKHKLRVLQVERGTPEEVSYRCDDLKSGRVVVFRPGM